MKKKVKGIGYQVKASVLAAALTLSMAAGETALLTVHAAEDSGIEAVWQDGGCAYDGDEEGKEEPETDEDGEERAGAGISSGIAGKRDGGINPCGNPNDDSKEEN